MKEDSMTEQQGKGQLPVGYWLKHVDRLLTERSDAALSERGFTRLRWQTMNTIAEAGSISRASLYETLRPFANREQLDALVAGLIQPGWVAEGRDRALTVTESGQAEHAQLLQLQQTVRQRAFAGVSAEEYAMLVAVLQRVAGNLS
jgi:hypothetical protein